jgi:beta-1,4-mannosyl-glycoprotein beta-1,4-N-acetylglucosaminyltransferase
MKVYDGFTFYNELDMLRVRLVEHSPFVDSFILVEGDRTFSGQPKPSYFDPMDDRFKAFRHKIIHVTTALNAAPCDAWFNERSQRRAILSAVTPSPEDILLIGDVDEIVSRNHWAALLSEMRRQPAIAIRMACYYYYINLMTPEYLTFSKMFRYDYIVKNGLDADSARWLSSAAPRPRVWKVPDSYGRHFSYIGSPDFIRNKISSFSHQEYNNSTYAAPERIREAVERGIDLFGRWGNKRFLADLVDERWPLEMINNPLWKQFVCKPDPAMRRIAWKIAHKMEFCANGVAARIRYLARRRLTGQATSSGAIPTICHFQRKA